MGSSSSGVGRQAAEPLARFNGLPAAAARVALLACCNSASWTDRLLAGRPYRTADAAASLSDAGVAAMTRVDLADALAGHPRIGSADGQADTSRSEQVGALSAGADIIAALAVGNAAYEHRFGHIYLVCATGRSGQELLALLQARLCNDPDAEWDVVRTELAKINQLRLRNLLSAPS